MEVCDLQALAIEITRAVYDPAKLALAKRGFTLHDTLRLCEFVSDGDCIPTLQTSDRIQRLAKILGII